MIKQNLSARILVTSELARELAILLGSQGRALLARSAARPTPRPSPGWRLLENDATGAEPSRVRR